MSIYWSWLFRSSASPLCNSVEFCLLAAASVSFSCWHSFHLISWFKESQMEWQSQICRSLDSNVLSSRNYVHSLSEDGFEDPISKVLTSMKWLGPILYFVIYIESFHVPEHPIRQWVWVLKKTKQWYISNQFRNSFI